MAEFRAEEACESESVARDSDGGRKGRHPFSSLISSLRSHGGGTVSVCSLWTGSYESRGYPVPSCAHR